MTAYHRVLPLILLLFFCTNCSKTKQFSINEYYQTLDKIRDQKHLELSNYMKHVKATANSISDDEEMKKLFQQKNTLFLKTKGRKVTPDEAFQFTALRDAIENKYIQDYLIFYDILFINKDQDIFYTIRRQKNEYRKNLTQGNLAKSKLAQALNKKGNNSVIDFFKYQNPDRPSAFFVIPNQSQGWFVLQFTIERINDLFTAEKSLGSTGEVFLVNRNSYMLTDSIFYPSSTILNAHLSEENIQKKFKLKEGHLSIIDYRGKRSISSFKTINFWGLEWLISTKIDEDEILTDVYSSNINNLKSKILQKATMNNIHVKKSHKKVVRGIEVDIDEVKRVVSNETLYTHGVSSCTAFIITLPGKFSYMAHVSAYDKIYGGKRTDLLNRMLRKLERFDVVDIDKRHIKVKIISPEIHYSARVIDTLVEWGLFLSQIKIIHNKNAKYANLSHNHSTSETDIEWWPKNPKRSPYTVSTKNILSLGEILRRELGLESNPPFQI